mmetsp:Transcript_11595/g.40336  ORF Transcript_11595/g.40336 Transcript_11595/m.40336 type:complete len:360 (-) Transcript_11595:328-1407(-)
MPLVMRRCTTSSSALLDGAQMSTCACRCISRPRVTTCRGAGAAIRLGPAASRGFGLPAIHGELSMYIALRDCLSQLWRAALAAAASWSSRSLFMPPLPPGTACMITLSSAWIVRVLPVPGGPWMSTTGLLSMASLSDSCCDLLYSLASRPMSVSGVRHGGGPEALLGFPDRSTSRKDIMCADCSASHSRWMVDRLHRHWMYQKLPSCDSAARVSAVRMRSTLTPSTSCSGRNMSTLRLPAPSCVCTLPSAYLMLSVSSLSGRSWLTRTKSLSRYSAAASVPTVKVATWKPCLARSKPRTTHCWISLAAPSVPRSTDAVTSSRIRGSKTSRYSLKPPPKRTGTSCGRRLCGVYSSVPSAK